MSAESENLPHRSQAVVQGSDIHVAVPVEVVSSHTRCPTVMSGPCTFKPTCIYTPQRQQTSRVYWSWCSCAAQSRLIFQFAVWYACEVHCTRPSRLGVANSQAATIRGLRRHDVISDTVWELCYYKVVRELRTETHTHTYLP